ncbi:MAG: twin-arginine translocation signal domain-containing protein, partial [Planctomycetaceae bacterium]
MSRFTRRQFLQSSLVTAGAAMTLTGRPAFGKVQG